MAGVRVSPAYYCEPSEPVILAAFERADAARLTGDIALLSVPYSSPSVTVTVADLPFRR